MNNMVEVLMAEHRLIERVIAILGKRSLPGKELSQTDVDFLSTIVDFFQEYADRIHHGKEEGILFSELAKKQLSAEHAAMMNGLINEHIFARVVTHRMREAQAKYTNGDGKSIAVILQSVQDLVKLYPVHIQKEETRFFHLSFEYLNADEQRAILAQSQEFDGSVVHEKYQRIVEALEKLGQAA